MAVMNTLRTKLGKFVVFAVGLAIVSFVVADLLGPNSFLFGRDTNVGEMAGEEISFEEYQGAIDNRKLFYEVYSGRNPSEREMVGIRNQAWDLLLSKTAYQEEFEKLGITVTEEEHWDMVQGKNISQTVKGSFTNPETQEFDRSRFISYLQYVSKLPDGTQDKVRWLFLENEMDPGRKRLKYENLLVKANYVTEAEAEKEYEGQGTIAEAQYLYVPFYSIADSTVQVNDSQLKEYYDENKERYKVERSRDLSYVSFEVLPSKEDTTYFRDELKELTPSFKQANNDSVFAKINSDVSNFFGSYNPGTLPSQLKANISNLTEGDVRGPYLEGGRFKLYKVSTMGEDTVFSARASHILFKWENDTDEAKAKAKQEANDILNEIKAGADFAEMAGKHGTDGTKSRGGDLDWFTQGRKMVKEFDDAVFAKEGEGLINSLVETQFGYHIIEVTEAKTKQMFKIATIEREITPSEDTRNTVYSKAGLFASGSGALDAFTENAEKEGYEILKAEKVGANDTRVGSVNDAREVVRWLFREASTGAVSEAFDLDNAYLVAVMTGEQEKGYNSLENVKTEVTTKVKNKLKGEQVSEKLKGLSGSLDEMAKAYGTDANVYSKSDLKLSEMSLPTVGFDPVAVGKVFSLEPGEKSAPFISENGVLVLQLNNLTPAPEIADYATYKDQLLKTASSRASFGIDQAVREAADITDERYKYQ